MKGVNTEGVNISNLRYADDTVLLAEGPMFLQALLTANQWREGSSGILRVNGGDFVTRRAG